MGLSLGINFSVRSALICEYQRPGEGGFTDYQPSEVLQMLGRAGRRGKDAVGYSLWPHVEAYSRLGKAVREPVSSRLRADPTTFLGLRGRGFDLERIEAFYAKSFRRFSGTPVDLELVTYPRLKRQLRAASLPCQSPAAAYGQALREEPRSPCFSCPHRPACHPFLRSRPGGSLAALHLHLHRIGALDEDESLTAFGSVARYFPQAGGLVLARMIASGQIAPEQLGKVAELAAVLSLARFKEPGGDPRYNMPFAHLHIETQLEELYPYTLFPEVYDPPYRQRLVPVIREFNPAAGYPVRAWIQGLPWVDLARSVTSEAYGTGDLMALIYRSATYLQSIVQAGDTQLAPVARTLRDLMLREPLSYALSL